jgi:formate/nitrite transporter FocA (FNT family)
LLRVQEIAHHGEEKAKFHWSKLALLGMIAGCYCGFGFSLCLLVGGNMPREWLEHSPGLFSLLYGVVGFPFSFTLIVVCGAELCVRIQHIQCAS